MFRKNDVAQLSLDDKIITMPKYLQKALDKSWAGPFHEHILSNINEERFEVLYSETASRPNTPVNVIVGLLILKDIFGLSEEDVIGSLHFDTRFQYALGTTSYDEQPVSINTLYNFRTRVLKHEELTKRDLIKEEIESLAEHMGAHMKIDGKTIRMDSMMISSSCKKLSRIELVYAVNIKMIKLLDKINSSLIPEELRCYLENGHKNDTIYRTRDKDANTKLEWLLSHSLLLHRTCLHLADEIVQSDAYLLLKRMIEEQTTESEESLVVPKEGKELHSKILQNPSDPDATYRDKYTGNIGYVANLAESFNEKSGVISHYDFKENTYSDSKFCDDILDKLGKQDEVKILVDGAYYSYDLDQKAKEQGIQLIPTQLVGKKPSQEKLPYSSFEIDAETQKITACPSNEKPQMSYYSKKSHTAKFKAPQCENCPLHAQCPVKKEKKGYSVKFSTKSYVTSKQRQEMETKEYIILANKRAGVEGIPSVIRRKYNVDAMPVRGLLRSKLCFGFKVGAYNFKKLMKYLKKKGVSPLTFLLNHIKYTFTGNSRRLVVIFTN